MLPKLTTPIGEAALVQTLARVFDHRLALGLPECKIMIDQDHVAYVEGDANSTKFHLVGNHGQEKDVLTFGHHLEFFAPLLNDNFFRSGQSCIVNIKFIITIRNNRNVVLDIPQKHKIEMSKEVFRVMGRAILEAVKQRRKRAKAVNSGTVPFSDLQQFGPDLGSERPDIRCLLQMLLDQFTFDASSRNGKTEKVNDDTQST